MSREITPQTTRYLANITIDPKSLEIQESIAALNAQVALQTTIATEPSTTIPPPPPRTCSELELSYCKHLPYNITSYPNIFGHKSIIDVEDDVITFRLILIFI